MSEKNLQALFIFLKGAAMGAANVIPGVSGGTVAFITGIYERLINGIKSVNAGALKLLFTGKVKAFAERTDFGFLALLGGGVVASILTLARVFKYLFAHHPVFLWSFFFGLILASILFVGAKVKRWGAGPVVGFLIGAGIAVGIALLKPASENDGFIYLMLCGVVAMASMIMPGISGSFVLLLMGNYQLIMIDSVAKLTDFDLSALRILIPVGLGAVIGLVSLSHFLSWVFRRHHDLAVALLTGFVAGSLLIIWPWKREILQTFAAGEKVKEKVIGYEWLMPSASPETWIALGVMAAGFALVWLMERWSGVPKPGADSERT
jgi:putative membrane protein